jgi:hypothetical protein
MRDKPSIVPVPGRAHNPHIVSARCPARDEDILAVMMGLLEHYAKVPPVQRRRNIRFLGSAGHPWRSRRALAARRTRQGAGQALAQGAARRTRHEHLGT